MTIKMFIDYYYLFVIVALKYTIVLSTLYFWKISIGIELLAY